jgi:hypothetical protein
MQPLCNTPKKVISPQKSSELHAHQTFKILYVMNLSGKELYEYYSNYLNNAPH